MMKYLTPIQVVSMLIKQFIAVSLFHLLVNQAHAATAATENGFDITPSRCVALRQGQTCFQDVVFKWQQAHVGNYCVVELSTSEPLKCWKNTSSGELNIDFQSDKTLTYVLRKDEEPTNIASSTITVSWVFKSSKRPKSSWKLF